MDSSREPLVVEISWEACSQTGGIYTVLRTKCAAGLEKCGDDYMLIGPFREQAARIEFEPMPLPPAWQEAVDDLAGRGVKLHCGRWLITGRPRVILIDLASVADHLDSMKYFLWESFGIGVPPHDHDCDETVMFGYVVADLLTALRKRVADRELLAHFHEWQAAVAIPLIRKRGIDVATVFTTHATLVGRSLSAANKDIYGDLERINPEAVATEHGIRHRFEIERAAARDSDTFTTVSEITAQEAEHFLGCRPGVVLPNGLHVERFGSPHEFQNLHQRYKQQIHEFVMGHFFPSYGFELDKTLYVFLSGRYEYRNKGVDVFIDALAEVNRRLKAEPRGTTIVAFIVVRAAYLTYNVETLNRQAMLNELRDTCQSIKEDMGLRLFRTVTGGRLPTTKDLLDEYAGVRLQRMIHAWRQDQLPPVVTHDLEEDARDPVLARLRRHGLLNAESDPVKIVFHPEFIVTASPVLGMEYDQFVRGCNLGVFPSYYEPWGYTPMECIVRGIPAVTSDLSGFGSYVMEHFPDHDEDGLYVTRRRDVPYENSVYQVAGWIHQLTRLSLRERIHMRNRTESYAEYFDWSNMARYYRAARVSAVKRHRETWKG